MPMQSRILDMKRMQHVHTPSAAIWHPDIVPRSTPPSGHEALPRKAAPQWLQTFQPKTENARETARPTESIQDGAHQLLPRRKPCTYRAIPLAAASDIPTLCSSWGRAAWRPTCASSRSSWRRAACSTSCRTRYMPELCRCNKHTSMIVHTYMMCTNVIYCASPILASRSS